MLRESEHRNRKQIFFLMELFPLRQLGIWFPIAIEIQKPDLETSGDHPPPCPAAQALLTLSRVWAGHAGTAELLLHSTRSRSKAQQGKRRWQRKPPAAWGEEIIIQNPASCPGQYQSSGEALVLCTTSGGALLPKSPKLQGYFRPSICHFTRMGCYLWGWDNPDWWITDSNHGDVHTCSPVCCATQQDACGRTPPCQSSWNSPWQSWQKDTVNSSGWIYDSYIDNKGISTSLYTSWGLP